MAEYGCVCPFLDESPAFAHGVEFGMLYARMRDGGEDVIEDYCLLDNQEQITLLANRLGWRVTLLDCETEGWFRCRLERGGGS